MAARHPAAFINAIADEGTKAEAIHWLQTIWDENCDLRSKVSELEIRISEVLRGEKHE